MSSETGFLTMNQHAWDNRVAHHIESEFYNVQAFKEGHNPLHTIETALLGNISGKSLLHLQCHFGLDTLALARAGATVTGLDFSPVAVEKAKALAAELSIAAEFVCCNVYDARQMLPKTFDMVFTTYGTIGWLPDLDRWAAVVSESLKPGGCLVFAEFHPVVWMFNNTFTKIEYSYFNTEAIVEEATGTYADKNAALTETTISWNHGLSEVISALLNQGLRITHFGEYDYSPYPCFENLVKIAENKYQIAGMEGKIPMVYSIVAEKI